MSIFRKGIFWMFVGVSLSCAGAIWLFSGHAGYSISNKPIAFHITIAGFLIYVIGRILQVVQRRKKSKKVDDA